MSTRPLLCAECNTLLYLPGPNTGSVDFDNPNYLTVEQMIIIDIACSSATCPSQERVLDPFGLMAEPSLEQPGYVLTVNPEEIAIGGQQTPLSSNGSLPPPSHGQQQQQQAQAHEQQLLDNVPMETTDGMTVHHGPNPCRTCFQRGFYCHRDPGRDSCSQCSNRAHPIPCIQSLFKAVPAKYWKTKIIHDYAPPFLVHASAMRAGTDSRVVLQYLVKWPMNRFTAWEPAEDLTEYQWVLNAFHLANPGFPSL